MSLVAGVAIDLSVWLPDVDVERVIANLAQLGVAFALALPIGYDREQATSLGLRTFPLVAVASCAFLLVGQDLATGDANANTRVLQGTITGIGFLGGGAIVKQGLDVKGTATAAAIWATAAVGASVAYRRYEMALTLSVLSFVTLRWMSGLKRMARQRSDGDEPK